MNVTSNSNVEYLQNDGNLTTKKSVRNLNQDVPNINM